VQNLTFIPLFPCYFKAIPVIDEGRSRVRCCQSTRSSLVVAMTMFMVDPASSGCLGVRSGTLLMDGV